MLSFLLPATWVAFTVPATYSATQPSPYIIEAQADGPVAGTQAPDQAQSGLQGKFVQELGDKAIAIMGDAGRTQDQRLGDYRSLLRADFDLRAIGRFVLGSAWNSATPQQRESYLKTFEELVLDTYGNRLGFLTGVGFHVQSVRKENDKDSVVTSQVTRTGDSAPPISIDWRVRQNGDRYSIIDVVIDGVSQSVTQRQEYAAILQRNNGNIDALIDLMRQRLSKNSVTAPG